MAYSKAKISIPNVTGNIVITATATPSVTPITNLIDTYGVATNTRISASSGNNSTQTGCVAIGSDTTKLIPVTQGDIIRIKGTAVSIPTSSSGTSSICLYNSDGTYAGNSYTKALFIGQTSNHTVTAIDGGCQIVIGNLANTYPKLRICFPCTDTTDLVITKNQEIPIS